jgi:hypothetical protein
MQAARAARPVLALLALVAWLPSAAADETWRPVDVNGVEYEVNLTGGRNGNPVFRMPPGRLDATLDQLGGRVAQMSRDTRGLNLPAELLAAPDRIFREVAEAARGMGPDLVFYSPPNLGGIIDQFSFNDGKRLVSFTVADPVSENISPMVQVEFKKLSAGKWVLDRGSYVSFGNKGAAELKRERETGRAWAGSLGSPWVNARQFEELGTRSGRKKTILSRSYDAMTSPGQWFGSEYEGGRRGRYVLRSVEARTGRTIESRVNRKQAERLYILATGKRFRTTLPPSHPDFRADIRTKEDIPTAVLRDAGLETVVDRRGRAYLRRARGGVDRAKLTKLGLTYVAPGRGRSAYLRHRPSAKARPAR